MLTQRIEPRPKAYCVRFEEFRQKHVLDGMMRDHVAGSGLVDFQAKRRVADFQESCAHAALVFPHRIGVGHACGFRVMLRLAKATVVAAHKNLHLFTALAMRAEDIKIRITGDAVERRFELLAVAHGTARPQIERDRARNRKAAPNRRINRRVNRRGPAAAGKPDHVKRVIARKAIGALRDLR